MLKFIPIFFSAIALLLSGISIYFQFLRKRFAVSGIFLRAYVSQQEEFDSVFTYSLINEGSHKVLVTDARHMITTEKKRLKDGTGQIPFQKCHETPFVLEPGDIKVLKINSNEEDKNSNQINYTKFSIVTSKGKIFELIHNFTDYGSLDEAKRSKVWHKFAMQKTDFVR